MSEPEIVYDAQKHLAAVYREQGHYEKACEMYKSAFMQLRDHNTSFELAQIYACL